MWVEDTPEGMQWLDAFKKNQLGENEYNKLLFRKQQTVKRDDAIALKVAKELLDTLEVNT
jgi:hypothetical protein